ncbi:ABC transporter permease [Patescibacteria group bacterium]|nr:ABC transporter permease [Patescibacteria group bacterium]
MNWIGLYTIVQREIKRMLRVPGQTILSPLISATLYIFIFGYVIGTNISEIAGVPYITFVFPGILMLNIIASSFAQSSSSVYFARFIKSIEEMLVSPLSYLEIIAGYVIGGIARSLVVGFGILIIGLLFGAVTLASLPLFLFYVVAIAIIFSLLGILVGLWAKGFEQLSAINIFVITPLTYLGGIFYSVTMLPGAVQFITYANPFFYFVDGIRASMIGISEANVWVGLGIIFGLILTLGWLVTHLFATGWRIRP